MKKRFSIFILVLMLPLTIICFTACTKQQPAVFDAVLMQSGTDNGFYTIKQNNDLSANIIYYDYTNMQKSYLGANFISAQQNAQTSFLPDSPMGCYAFTDGKSLYVYKHGNYIGFLQNGEAYRPTIYKSNLDGTNRTAFALSEYYEPLQSCGFAAEGDNIYFVAFVKDQHRASGGKTGVMRLDTTTGECKLISWFNYKTGRYLHIVGTFKNGLVLERIHYPSANQSEQPVAHVAIQLLYLGTGSKQTVFEYDQNEIDGKYDADGKFYFAKKGEASIYCKDLLTNTDTPAFENIFVDGIQSIDRILFFGNKAVYNNNLIAEVTGSDIGGNQIYTDVACNLLTGTVTPLDIKIFDKSGQSTVSQIYAEGENGLFVSRSYLNNVATYAFISKNDYFNNTDIFLDFENNVL